MDDDEQFKIAYGTDLEITDPIVKLRIDQSGYVSMRGPLKITTDLNVEQDGSFGGILNDK